MAESLYHGLRAKGYNPFFSKYSIDANGRSDYVTLINNALESAKILVVVGSSRKNLTSRWVKREISIFSALMMREEEGARTLLTYRSEEYQNEPIRARKFFCIVYHKLSSLSVLGKPKLCICL